MGVSSSQENQAVLSLFFDFLQCLKLPIDFIAGTWLIEWPYVFEGDRCLSWLSFSLLHKLHYLILNLLCHKEDSHDVTFQASLARICLEGKGWCIVELVNGGEGVVNLLKDLRVVVGGASTHGWKDRPVSPMDGVVLDICWPTHIALALHLKDFCIIWHLWMNRSTTSYEIIELNVSDVLR